MIDHIGAAESILEALRLERDPVWAQVHATRALAHATLALVPRSTPTPREAKIEKIESVYGDFSGADELPEVISWQGSGVGRLANNEPFKLRDVAELKRILDQNLE